MLGLKKGVVRVVEHRPDWSGLFRDERGLLLDALGELAVDIQHVGSTAVPDLVAKPILDMALAVAAEEDIPRCVGRLVEAGYLDRGDQGGDGGHLLVRETAPEFRTHHLHIVALRDPQWRNYLRFRDTLRADGSLRARYTELKRDLEKLHGRDRNAYTDGKDAFIRGVIEGRGTA